MPLDVDELDWPHLLCNWCRQAGAEVLYEDEPLCCSCADVLLEREAALMVAPELADVLPALR